MTAICAPGVESRGAGPRFFVDRALHAGDVFALPASAARHVQVLRLQPGSPLLLFNGQGGEWQARVVRMGRSEVEVEVAAWLDAAAHDRSAVAVTLAFGMPANDRMDALVEKATELGVAAIQPLICERSVLRLNGERAEKKVAHWQAVAVAACEQSGRDRVPRILPVRAVRDWLHEASLTSAVAARRVLSLRHDARPIADRSLPAATEVVCLSGPEGGLTEAEEDLARGSGFAAVSLGPRVLRADTAPLAVLAYLMLASLTA